MDIDAKMTMRPPLRPKNIAERRMGIAYKLVSKNITEALSVLVIYTADDIRAKLIIIKIIPSKRGNLSTMNHFPTLMENEPPGISELRMPN